MTTKYLLNSFVRLCLYEQYIYIRHSESIEQLALKEVCVTVHLLLTAARRTPAVRASRRTVWASWLVSQYKGVTYTILGSVLTMDTRQFVKKFLA